MDSREFSEWLAYDRINPIGGRRIDYAAAIICQTVGELINGEKAPLENFIPEYGLSDEEIEQRERTQDGFLMMQQFITAAQAAGIEVIDARNNRKHSDWLNR